MQPIVAVVADVREFEKYRWHAAPDTYLEAAMTVAGVLPVLVPALGERIDFTNLLTRVDGVMLTGSKSNVHPQRYGQPASAGHEPFDEARDATALPLIRATVEAGVPLFAICRGMQELNVALGGSIATEIQEQDGIDDHRAPVSDDQAERFAIAHGVNVKPGSCMASITGAGRVDVNSLHRQAIDTLAPGLRIEATADDGTIEAVSVTDAKGFAIGVQWHPEYWARTDTPSRALFEAFGNAVRAYAENRELAA
ncbi:gamma-glutamyl-gamma-aminobutyrate hydrolase family protein [Oricola cellulosilytica]|uniref:gamma-glutamyl-gamma-aminobutyrate hydrolase n=1 Tax=Oricola cellulosilytica TaxID=1429082 RepID=A0A4R0P773_9HYPH|nr:gamma-glutamyl-gamma-aminobutyrate hydrolase family protein [Oricola cellulosilytica]TCD11345.1 gamma-glutamyl-gamma-aminobutyrate hydrolase family protein [Oricola cellulosilytica]